MHFLVKSLKILSLVVHLLYGGALVVFQALILKRASEDPRFKAVIQAWYAKSVNLVGLSVKVHGKPADGPVLMVSNHISWLDIPLMASLSNPRFLSKAEVRNWPIIGWAGETLNTLFIVRGQRSATEAASAAISEGLENNDRILIFPEGTTTDGLKIGFLYPRLFGAAIQSQANIQPVVIHYTDDNSDGHSSELIPYIGTQTLVDNIWTILGCKNPQAHVYFLDVVDSSKKPRKALAAGIQQQMQDCLMQSHTEFLAAKPLIHK